MTICKKAKGLLRFSLLTNNMFELVLPAPTLSSGNPGAASRSKSLLGLRRIAFLQESGRRRASNANGRHLAAVCLFLRSRRPKKKLDTYFESMY
jgi:hypothetical protein